MNDFEKFEKSIQRYDDFVKRLEQKKTVDHNSFRNRFKIHANEALNDDSTSWQGFGKQRHR